MEIDSKATERILKARAELILARRFYGVLVSNVEPVLSRQFPTMATNGKQHFFNPEFIMGLPPKQVLGVQAHESEHDARHHGTRRGERDARKWNEACDYAINLDLIAEGFELPKDALIDQRFRGMSAEDIYRIRELDEQAKQPPPPPEPEQSEPEQSESEQSEKDEQGNGNGEDEDEDEDEPEQSDGESDEQSDQSEDAEGDQPSGSDEGEGEGKSGQRSSGDPGGCGEVLDAAQDAGELAETDQSWERIVRQAAAMAKAIGQLPGHVTRDIERANNPPQDWREVLRAWIDQGARQCETWNRPNRRLIGSNLYLPGRQRDGLNKVCFVIDTSGSMDPVALACVRTEAQAALDDGAIDEVIVIYGDTRVTRTDNYREGDEIEFDPRGGGGTDMKPLFAHVEREIDDPSLIICFTDGFIGDPGPQPSAPVLWCYAGYPDVVRRMIETAPWGAPGIDVGEH